MDLITQIELTELLKSSAQTLIPDDNEYRELRSHAHPDRFPNNSKEQERAEKAFKKLELLYELTKIPTIVVKSKSEYALGDLIGVGDVSNVYRASSGGSHDYVVKVSRIAGGDVYLNKEANVLKKLNDKAGDTTYKNYVPRLVESFVWNDDFKKRINVFEEPYRLYSLKDIKNKYKDGVDGRHVSWIFRRILTGLGFCHLQGVVHGAILPTHVLVEPKSHGVCLGGWIHSVENALITVIPESYKDWYPEEVTKKLGASPSTDIYMAAKCMLDIMDKDTPKRIKLFLESLLIGSQKARPNDAWKLETEFTNVMDDVYGPRKFLEFKV